MEVGARIPDVEGLRAEPFDLLVCGACGGGTTSPVPDPHELAPYYPEAFYGRLGTVGEVLMALFLRQRVARLGAALRPPARVLDVGCGDGRFLAALRSRGFDVVGLEPSAAGREAARTRVDHVGATFADVRGESFDAVTLWQVLEHAPDPLASLAEVRDVMRPGGLLVVSVPNFGSVEARAFGPRWFHLDVPRHLVHFTEPALRGLLDRAGFAVESLTTASVEYNPFGLLQSAMNALPIRHNALYHVVKRGTPLRALDGRSRMAVGAALLLLPLAAAAAAAGAVAQELLGRGATLTARARLR